MVIFMILNFIGTHPDCSSGNFTHYRFPLSGAHTEHRNSRCFELLEPILSALFSCLLSWVILIIGDYFLMPLL